MYAVRMSVGTLMLALAAIVVSDNFEGKTEKDVRSLARGLPQLVAVV